SNTSSLLLAVSMILANVCSQNLSQATLATFRQSLQSASFMSLIRLGRGPASHILASCVYGAAGVSTRRRRRGRACSLLGLGGYFPEVVSSTAGRMALP